MRIYVQLKNVLDPLLALLALVLLSPLLALIAIGVSVDSPGKPIFRQLRVGKHGRRFMIYKFRTMYQNNDDSNLKLFLKKYVEEGITSRFDENGHDKYQLVCDPRVTRFGSLLRKTNLDEILQLLNVLKGEMSLIGPRPEIPFTAEMYKPHHKKRLLAKPGMTGLYQVSGRRGLSFDDQVGLDVEYINKQSPLMDAKILLLTVREVFTTYRRYKPSSNPNRDRVVPVP
ncbi:MAG: hypothetical protein AMJ43_07285 [Coxiella sp. DG_40]|nr:MAG: hypothetical protein AMJ43_07285 [Coxiella sp. DG_40]